MTFFICSINLVNGQENGYSWLYDSNGNLIANNNIKIDTNISKCSVDRIGYTYYLGNRLVLLNKLNPTIELIQTAYAPSFILKIKLKTKKSSVYEVYEVCVVDKLVPLDSDLLKSLRQELIGTKLYDVCGNENFYLHIPVRYKFEIVESLDEIGIYKEFKDGWFIISIRDNPVIDN